MNFIDKSDSNLYHKVLKNLIQQGVTSPKLLANTLDISKELLDTIIQSLLKQGFLKLIDEGEFQKEASLKCKFCSFANECSENLPKIFFEISEKGKKMINLDKPRKNINNRG